MSYGVPYKGSKNLIAAKLAEAIPGAANFYDLFAGGCAVTHRMMETGRFKRYFANDFNGRSRRSFPPEEHYNMMRTFMPALNKDYNGVVSSLYDSSCFVFLPQSNLSGYPQIKSSRCYS